MPIQEIPVGRYVECDLCCEDLTNDPRSGGFMFGGQGVGPCCADRLERRARQSGEGQFIGARCPDGKSFADWVRDDVRGGVPGVIQIFTGDDADDWLGAL